MRQLAIAVSVFLLLFFSGASRLGAEEPKMGTVDLARAFDEFKRTKDAEKVLEAEGAKKKEDRDKKVEEIKRLKGELELLNDKGKAEKQALIDQKVQELQGFDREVQESLRRERDRAIQDILKEIDTVIETYGRDNGFTLLLNDRALVYTSETLDVTDKIIEILNKGSQNKKRE